MIPRRQIVALALAATAAIALPRAAAAQTKADAFAGKIPPVSGQLFRKAGRLELTTSGNLSLNDAFFKKYFGGLKVGWHLTEAWSVGLQAAGGFATRSGSAVVCSASAGCSAASETQLRQVPGRIRAMVGIEGAWSPVYGKLNALSEQVAHFDLSILGGLDAIAYDEILSRQDADLLALNGGDPSLATTGGAHFGVGARVFFAPWIAARLEVKDYVYVVKVPNNGTRNDWQHQLFTELGLSFFFPTGNRPVR